MFQHFINKKLALAVWIASVYNAVSFPDELADQLELSGCFLFDLVLPLGGNYWKVIALPFRKGFIIILWPRLSQHVPEAPGYNVIAAVNAAFTFFLIAEAICYGAAKTWFFSDKQSHIKLSCAFLPRFFVR